MRAISLGISGPPVSVVGLGCMGMSWGYDQVGRDDVVSVSVIHRAIALGCTLIDTADQYGPFTNEELVGRALRGRRDQVVLATKGGLVVDDPVTHASHRDGRPEHLRAAIEASLRRLGTDHVDLYQLHRVDPAVGIEDSWGAMAELVQAGKAAAIGLSEATVDEIERARQIYPVASVQTELSLWSREALSDGVLEHCRKHGITFIAYSPLGRGFLAGAIGASGDLPVVDGRHDTPRFQAEAIAANQAIVQPVRDLAARLGVTAAQVALAWVLHQGEHVAAIPGTKTPRYLEDNLRAADLPLPEDALALFDSLPTPRGTRY